ncbi:MAG: hypothetical protein ACR5KV_03975 [Wolbachia sp.]
MVRCSDSRDFYSLKDFNEEKLKKCKSDNSEQPEIEIKYKENSKSKILCLSGWQSEPEEFILEKGSELIPLKSTKAEYNKYDTVYSKESNQSYYFPCNETVDVLAEFEQKDLDEIIFNKKGYISISKENQNRDNCVTNKDDEIGVKYNCNKCKTVCDFTDEKQKKRMWTSL